MPPLTLPYLLDTNIFVQASRTYYSFNFAPGFWDKLVAYGEQGKIISIDKVLNELNDGDDQLKVWANSAFNKYFKTSESGEIALEYSNLVNWVYKNPVYLPSAKDHFMEDDNADAWVIAYAKVHNLVLVTEEKSNPASQRSVMIPDVCNAFGVQYCHPFKMLEELKFSL
jgi:hypothetical protein